MSDDIRVLIAEDEAMIRGGLSILIQREPGMELVGTAENGLEALQQAEKLRPDLILMDIQMPVMSGIESIVRIRESHYEGIILILTTFNEEQYIIEGLANGANGYLLKGLEFRKLLQTIRDAMSGQYFLPSEVAAKLVQYISRKELHLRKSALAALAKRYLLSKRELEIIPMLFNRSSNRMIAKKLVVTEGTVRNYLTVIYEKLEVKNRDEAVLLLQNELQ